jgi:glutamate-ammonia-ligase adenylyltransferase
MGLGARVEAFRKSLLESPRDAKQVVADVAEMRDRIAAAKPARSAIEAKLGPGRMQDVELLAQSAALLTGKPSRRITVQLVSARQSGWIDDHELDSLLAAYRLMWQLQSAARLLAGDTLDLDLIGEGGRAFLLRETGADSAEDLIERLESVSARAGEVVDKALGRPPVLP